MMYTLELFNLSLLDALYKSGHKYFVRQTLTKTSSLFNDTLRASFLITHYKDLAPAEAHLNNFKHDGNACIYDLGKPEDQQKLYIAASQPDGYKVYTCMFLKEWKVSKAAALKIKSFIDNKLHWTPKKSDDVRANIDYRLGVFYLELEWNSIKASVTADEVERY